MHCNVVEPVQHITILSPDTKRRQRTPVRRTANSPNAVMRVLRASRARDAEFFNAPDMAFLNVGKEEVKACAMKKARTNPVYAVAAGI